MESVLLKANLVNLSTDQYWLNFNGQKGMSDCEGHGHKAVLYKSHFPPLRHSFRQRHHCIHRLINHVYYKGQAPLLFICPHDSNDVNLSNINIRCQAGLTYHIVRQPLGISVFRLIKDERSETENIIYFVSARPLSQCHSQY